MDSIIINALDTINFGISIISVDGLLRYINKKGIELLQLPDSNLNSINLYKKFPYIHEILNNSKALNNTCEENILLDIHNTTIACDIYGFTHENKFSGYILILKDNKSILRTVNKYNNNTATFTFNSIVGESKQIRKVINDCNRIADTPSSVLITGESGSGKELLAQAIHNGSSRRNGPFVALNCGAIPKSLIESELFGYEEGTFTGSKKGGNTGKFELANGGTIFLDEIGEMPYEMQVTLLRVLQEGYITKVGGKKNIPVDIRVIAATNKNLKEEIRNGKFRSDLFYRLNVIPINVPPLKDRIGDVPILLNYFLRQKSLKLDKPVPTISQSLYKKIISYCWPGNVRELENCSENIVNLNGSTTYEIDFDECHCLERDNLGNPIDKDEPYLKNASNCCINCGNEIVPLLTLEINAIKNAIEVCEGNMTRAATCLGISRNALYNKIKRYNIK